VLVASGCAGGYGRDFGGLAVAAGFYPLAWAAEEVGGDRVDVLNLTPQGVDPDKVEPTARHVELLRRAHLILLLRGFQPALDRAAANAESARVVDLLAAGSPTRDSGGKPDPHVWLDPLRFAQVVRRIGDELALPARAELLATRLEALDREYRRGLASCDRRQVASSGDAFGYLAARYDLELVRGEGARPAGLDPIDRLSAAQRERGDDYFSVMRANLRTLRRALGCR
jgi:zinc transport system substrate-binding protein